MSYRIGFAGMIAIAVLVCTVLLPRDVWPQQHSYVPEDGFVPNERTAIRIAEAVLDPIYGEDKIEAEGPLDAKLNDAGDTWIVWGHLPKPANKGGAAYIPSRRPCSLVFSLFKRRRRGRS